MTSKAKAIQTLYRAGRITKEGVRQSVEKDIITAQEYYIITGEYFDEPETKEVISEEQPNTDAPEVLVEENIPEGVELFETKESATETTSTEVIEPTETEVNE